ncbi:MAG: hypothetical protein ABIT96_03155 [Ferruginibacter sp.]
MKKILFACCLSFVFLSCEKEDAEDENNCLVVDAKSIPVAVNTGFTTLYPGATALKWFNKDGNGYAVLSELNGKKTLLHFDNNGNYVRTETNLEQQGEHHDDNDDGECECEAEED